MVTHQIPHLVLNSEGSLPIPQEPGNGVQTESDKSSSQPHAQFLSDQLRYFLTKAYHVQSSMKAVRQNYFVMLLSHKGPRPLAQCRFRAVQCRRCRHNALRVFKWMCVHYSRVVLVKFIIVSSPLPEQALVLRWTVMAADLLPLHTDPHAYSCVECGRCKTWRGKSRE
jgi:hypothetical protein